jgi:hypothetical protein
MTCEGRTYAARVIYRKLQRSFKSHESLGVRIGVRAYSCAEKSYQFNVI